MANDRSSPVSATAVGDMRPSKYTEQNPDSKTWTASIDVFRQYAYQDAAWHLSAIEFHHKDKEEAIALRDKAYAVLAKPGHAQCLDLEPVAYLHTLHMELGQTQRKLMWTEPSPFGIPGKHYSETYTVSCTPLYAQGPNSSTVCTSGESQ